MKTIKRVLSILMAVVLTAGLLPAGASAWNSANDQIELISSEFSSSHEYFLDYDGDVNLRIQIKNHLGPEEYVFMRMFREGGYWFPLEFQFYPEGEWFVVELNFTELFNEWEELVPGNYYFYAGIRDYAGMESHRLEEVLYLEIKGPEPLFEEPVVSDITMYPAITKAGSGSEFSVWGNMTFQNNYAVARRRGKLRLSRVEGDSRLEITSEIFRLELSYNQDSIRFHESLSIPGGLEAGDYVVEFVPNYDIDGHEDDNVIPLHEFTVEGPPVSLITLYVDTDRGQVAANGNAVGSKDVVTLRFDEWVYERSPYSSYLRIMPADLVLGSKGWYQKTYPATVLNGSAITAGGGIATIPGVVISSKEEIPPGEYVFYESDSYIMSEPFTIFKGQSSIESVLTGIEVKPPPWLSTYMAGDELDLSGIEIWASYDNASGRLVTEYTTDPVQGSVLSTDVSAVTVTYTEAGQTFSTSFDVAVLEPEGWTEIELSSGSNGIVIAPGSGNYRITGECLFKNPYQEYEDYLITVKSGYEGVIRLDGAAFLGADYENMAPILHDKKMKPVVVEEGASVIFDLVGENVLIGTNATGLTVSEGAEVSITSSSGGKLNVAGGTYGSAIGGDYGGVIKIDGSAEVNAASNSGPGIGGYGKYGSTTESDTVVIISGNAIVNAESYWSAGIGGAQSRAGGTIIIKGSAVVNAKSTYSTGIGGGSDTHTGGSGGNITIGENAIVNAFSEGSSAIGGGRGSNSSVSGGFGGNVTIEGNATVTAVSTGIAANGIGGGPNAFTHGSRGINLRITGGTVNAAGVDRGYDLGGNNGPNSIIIEGGSVYPAYSRAAETRTVSGVPTYLVTLTAEDGEGDPINGKHLNISGYKAITGKNPVWDEESKEFTSDLQQGVAYVWLPAGEHTIEGGNPGTILVDRYGAKEFTIEFDENVGETPQLGGIVTIEGEAKYGETLTANTEGITASEGEPGAFSFKWKRSGEVISGANGSTYILTAADIGKTITVTVTAAGCEGEVTSSATNTVTKADGPAAPAVTGSYTGDGSSFTYTLNTVTGAEYSKNGTNWQDDNVFTGFSANEAVTIYARIKETGTHKAGASGSVEVTFARLDNTAVPALDYTVSADRTKITITEVAGAEYKFAEDAWSGVNSKGGFSPGDTVTVQIRYAETATHNTSQPSSVNVSLSKLEQSAPDDFELGYTYNSNDKNFTVTIPAVNGAEYSFDGTDYGNTNTKTADPGDSVTGYVRYRETGTHNTSAPKSASLTLPFRAVSIAVTGQGGQSSITSRGGTLQMLAGVSPAEAAQTVTWSVANGGSYAKISESGLLTATADGTVTVRATAADGTGVFGELEVIISGQGDSNTGKPGNSGSSGNTSNASLGETEVSYDSDKGGTASVTLKSGSHTLRRITFDGKSLSEGTDYTVSGGTYTFTEEFLSSLEPGTHEITFEMSGGDNPVLSIKVTGEFDDPDTPLNPGIPPFNDIADTDWFYEAVVYVYQNGIMKGTGDTGFDPGSTLTRAMMVQILFNYDGGKPTASGIFADARDGQWYDDAVNWAAENEIVSGVGGGLFAPGREITREQMAVMLHNYCLYKGIELPEVSGGGFNDSEDISSWAIEAVEAMSRAGIINGKNGGVFDPLGTATRAEAAQMFMNFAEIIRSLGTTD